MNYQEDDNDNYNQIRAGQNEGRVCYHCQSPSGHYASCYLLRAVVRSACADRVEQPVDSTVGFLRSKLTPVEPTPVELTEKDRELLAGLKITWEGVQ